MKHYDEEKVYLRRRIAELEAENERLRRGVGRVTDLLVQGTELRSRMLLDAIVGGAYDKKEKKEGGG